MCDCKAEVERLRALVLALADKLATVAEHLGRLAERKELRDQPKGGAK